MQALLLERISPQKASKLTPLPNAHKTRSPDTMTGAHGLHAQYCCPHQPIPMFGAVFMNAIAMYAKGCLWQVADASGIRQPPVA